MATQNTDGNAVLEWRRKTVPVPACRKGAGEQSCAFQNEDMTEFRQTDGQAAAGLLMLYTRHTAIYSEKYREKGI